MPTLAQGDYCWVRHPNPRNQMRATVQRCRPDGSYDLSLDDGERLFRVANSALSLYTGGGDDDKKDGSGGGGGGGGKRRTNWNRTWVKVGVEVTIKASKASQVRSGKGTIVKVYAGKDRCDVKYSSSSSSNSSSSWSSSSSSSSRNKKGGAGELEMGVPTELLQPAEDVDHNHHDHYVADVGQPRFRPGALVRAKVFPATGSKGVSAAAFPVLGRVVSARENGVAATLGGGTGTGGGTGGARGGQYLYRVKFEDTRELEVGEAALTRVKEAEPKEGTGAAEGVLTKDCEVKVVYDGADGSEYGGVVGRLHPEGTVEVLYCDGTTELHVPRGCVARLPGAPMCKREVVRGGKRVPQLKWSMDARELHCTMHSLPVNTQVKAPGPYSDHCKQPPPGAGENGSSTKSSTGGFLGSSSGSGSGSSGEKQSPEVLLRGVVSRYDAANDVYDVAFDGSEPVRGMQRASLRPLQVPRGKAAEEQIETDKRWARHIRALRKLPLGAAHLLLVVLYICLHIWLHSVVV